MGSFLGRPLRLLRARWRWMRGHCPRCNRNLRAAFPNYRAGHPDCPVCKDEIAADLHLWHRYRAFGAAERPRAALQPLSSREQLPNSGRG